jgi:hypothetical protein
MRHTGLERASLLLYCCFTAALLLLYYRLLFFWQGVEDTYTDPQIHTGSGKGFGRGNLGQAGITAFLTRHKCNGICEHLGLPLLGCTACCFTAALLLLYCCFTASLLVLCCCFTADFLLLARCCFACCAAAANCRRCC